MAFTLSQTNGKFNSLKYNTLFNNPHQFKMPELPEDTKLALYEAYANSRKPGMDAPVLEKRSLLDRVFDGLMVSTYTLAGGVNNLVDKDPETTFLGGAWEGLKAGNPLGKGNPEGEVTFSKVLDTMGWQPESGVGKLLRGTVGLGLDIAFDPLTYVGGLGALVKGTGVVGQSAKALNEVAKTLPTSMLDDSGKLTKMTEEVADYIIKNDPSKAVALKTVSDADYKGIVSDFTRTYNRALGIREVGEVTIGLKNVPFGESLAKKIGLDDGTVTLANSNKWLMNIGKYSGAANVYGGTRNFLMGKKIIQKLSKTARYNQFAKVNPIELFDAVGFLKSTKGHQQSLTRAKQSALKASESLSRFSPAVQKLIIELEHDPANFKIVEGMFDDASSLTMEEYRKAYSKELEELLNTRQAQEGTYDAILADEVNRVETFAKAIEKEMLNFSDIKTQINELDYNVTWLNAERSQKISNLNAQKLDSVQAIDSRKAQIDSINKQYDETVSTFVKQKADLEKSIREMAQYLGKERSSEFAVNGYQLIKATPELIQHELDVLSTQFENSYKMIDEALANRTMSFEDAQLARYELADELEAEAKRIYNRQFYQTRKAKSFGKELAEQEKMLEDVTKQIEDLKSVSGQDATVKERAKLTKLITKLKAKRDEITAEISSINKNVEDVKKRAQELKYEEDLFKEMSEKSFHVEGSRFENMSEKEIQAEFEKALNDMLKEDADNKSVMKLAEQFALKMNDHRNFREIIGAGHEAQETLFATKLRSMFAELLLGPNGHIFPPKDVVINMARFVLTDKNDTEALFKYFTSKDNFFGKALKPKDASIVMEKIRVTGFVPVMREALTENYTMFSGNRGKFYNYLSSKLGYKEFSNVRSEMSALRESIDTQLQVINKGMEIGNKPMLLQSIKTNPIEAVENVASVTGLSADELGRLMRIKMPSVDETTQALAKANTDIEIKMENEILNGASREDVYRAYESDMNSAYQKYTDHVNQLAKDEADYYVEYDDVSDFLASLENALYKMQPNLNKEMIRLEHLQGIERIRDREIKYFFALDDVGQEEYMRYVTEDKRFGDFVQTMFNKEVERVRQVALDDVSNPDVIIPEKELVADFGFETRYSYEEVASRIEPQAVASIYDNIVLNQIASSMPKETKDLIASLKAEQGSLKGGIAGLTDGLSPIARVSLLDNSLDSQMLFIREAFRGNAKSVNVKGANQYIDSWLAFRGKGMDKRKKEYRDLKKQAETMRKSVDSRAVMVERLNDGENLFNIVSSEKTAVAFFESFGLSRLNKIFTRNKEFWDVVKKSGDIAPVYSMINGELNSTRQLLNDAYKEYDNILDMIAKKSNDPDATRSYETLLKAAKDDVQHALERYEETSVYSALFNFKTETKLQKALRQAMRELTARDKEISDKITQLTTAHTQSYFGDSGVVRMISATKRGLDVMAPYLITKLYPGKLFDELAVKDRYSLVHKGLSFIQKEFKGKVPQSVAEIETVLGEKLMDESIRREMVSSYNTFLGRAENGLHVIIQDTERGQITGKLVEADKLPKEFTKGTSVKVEVIKQDSYSGISSEIIEVPYEKVLRTKTSSVASIFSTVDKGLLRQLKESQDTIKQMLEDTSEKNVSKLINAKNKKLTKLNDEIERLYKDSNNLVENYYGKIAELEATQTKIATEIMKSQNKIDMTHVKKLEIEEAYQEKLGELHYSKFEEDDVFATIVPGTKEWDVARAFILKNDEELSELAEVIDESSPELFAQFEKMIEQRMLGYANGDGFKFFQEKVELTKQLDDLFEQVAKKNDELLKAKAIVDKYDGVRRKIDDSVSGLKATDEALKVIVPEAQIQDVARIQKEIDDLSKIVDEYDAHINRIDVNIQKSIDEIGTEIELLERSKAARRREIVRMRKANVESKLSNETNLKELEEQMHKLNQDVARLENVLENDEALTTLITLKYGKRRADSMNRKAQGLDGWKYALEDNANLDENVKKWAIWFHEEMRRIGVEEVKIGKLDKKSFETMINSYFPRVPSPEGERFFANNRELAEKIRPLTSDYGYGTKFNNHGISRVEELRHKSIYEVNDYFESEHGVRVFEEELGRAYVGRMVKHAELMYDDAYTKTIMDLFGYEIGSDLAIKEGYQAVANMGHIRDHIKDTVQMLTIMARKNGEDVTDEMLVKFQAQAVEKLKLKPEQLDDFKYPMVVLKGETLEALQKVGLARQMNNHIVEEANMARQMTIDRDNSRMLELYDKFTTWIKAMQTAVMPAFHARNFMSNMFQNWLAVGHHAFSWSMMRDSWQASLAMGNREKLRALNPINPIDKSKPVIHWEDAYDEAVIRGVIDEGFFAKDFDGHATSSGIMGGGKWDPTSTENFLPIKKGFEVGSIIENQGRLAQFGAHLKMGKSYDEAAEIVKEFLFDYSDLTLFEKRWMKRIFPYYTWMRKNSSLQARQLMEQPQKYALVAKTMKSYENSADPDNEIEDKYISDYARDWMITPFTTTKKETNASGEEFETKEPVLFSPNLPFMDIARLPDPFNVVESLKSFFAQTSPVGKTPLELLANYNTHFDSEIVKEGDNPLTKGIVHTLANLAWFNATKSMVTADSGADLGLSILNTSVGIKASSYDYEANKRDTVERAWEGFMEKSIGYYISNGLYLFSDAMTWEVKSALSKSIVKLAGLPKNAGEYSGTLAPISAETYDSLSDKDKKLYQSPTTGEAGYYNKRALELSQQAYEESGALRKFAWTLLDVVDVPYKNQIQAVRVHEVVDGDTLKVNVDGVEKSVRVLLVDTPESKGEYEDNPMAFGNEAYDFTKQMVLGKDVKIYFDGYDSYGRMLGFIDVGNSSLNEELIREGLGKVRYLFDRKDSNPDVKALRKIEQDAYNDKKGVWSIPGYAKPGDTDFEGGRSSK